MLTVKNEKNAYSDLEMVLKDKMNELSDSVDCFDKISARAFPEKDPNFCEGGYTVSDLENVTGRKNHGRILRWAALVAAVVLCIVFVPKTEIANRVFSNFSRSPKDNFKSILSEISEETERHTYQQLDVSLDNYIKNDILVTPLFSCPFEDCGRDNAMVRIYTREVGEGMYINYPTAQVYAVEYTGEYSESNIIAAAKSIYSFSDDDIAEPEIRTDGIDLTSDAIALNFSPDENYDYMLDSNGCTVSLASIDFGCYIRYNGKMALTSTSVLYGHNGIKESENCFYDSVTKFGGEIIDIPDRDSMWDESVYFNGDSAMPKENASEFVHKELYPQKVSDTERNFRFIGPFDGIVCPRHELKTNSDLDLVSSEINATVCSVSTPSDEKFLEGLRIYFAYDCSTEPQTENDGDGISEDWRLYCNNTMMYTVTRSSVDQYYSIEYDNLVEREQAAKLILSEKERIDVMLEEYEAKIETLRQQLSEESDDKKRDELLNEIDFNEKMAEEIRFRVYGQRNDD